MTHPNQYPGKTFVPYETTGEVETIETPVPSPDREGAQGVGPFPEETVLSEENLLDHGREELAAQVLTARERTVRIGSVLVAPQGHDRYKVRTPEPEPGTGK